MLQGTTPYIGYTLPFPASEVKEAEITIKYTNYSKEILIVKTTGDCEFVGNSIQAQLTQEETMKLPTDFVTRVQLRIEKNDGTVMGTVPQEIDVEELLNKGVAL